MERLREMTTLDLNMAHAGRLLSAMPSIDEMTMPIPRMLAGRASRRKRTVAPVLFAAALGLLAAASAATALVRGGHPARPSVLSPVSPAPVPYCASAHPVELLTVPTSSGSEPSASASGANVPMFRGDQSVPAPRPRVVGGSAKSEAALVFEAVRSLRRENDPAHASALAEEALRRYPHGAQAEEALVIVIQAAAARGDSKAAQQAARTYLARYPSGRFTSLANRLAGSH